MSLANCAADYTQGVTPLTARFTVLLQDEVRQGERMVDLPLENARPRKESIMNARLVVQAEVLRQTAERMARVGLVIERRCLSPEQRRAAFVLQCALALPDDRAPAVRGKIGFDYPNAR
jgi:hypothetical protein